MKIRMAAVSVGSGIRKSVLNHFPYNILYSIERGLDRNRSGCSPEEATNLLADTDQTNQGTERLKIQCKINLNSKGNKSGKRTVRGMRSMKKEYDFSKGERGKFYHPDVDLNLPVFLDPDVAAFLREVAEKKGTEIESIVNDWLRKSIDLGQSAK